MKTHTGFDPRRFLVLANKLIADGTYERAGRARTAMGRIYYAPFLLAFEKLQQQGIRIPNLNKIHESVIATYMDKGLFSIGDGLNQLRESRVDADYKMMANITLSKCKKLAKLSEYVIQLIDQVKEVR